MFLNRDICKHDLQPQRSKHLAACLSCLALPCVPGAPQPLWNWISKYNRDLAPQTQTQTRPKPTCMHAEPKQTNQGDPDHHANTTHILNTHISRPRRVPAAPSIPRHARVRAYLLLSDLFDRSEAKRKARSRPLRKIGGASHDLATKVMLAALARYVTQSYVITGLGN